MYSHLYNLAVDFGASSGRFMVSDYDGKKINLTEVYRFKNEPVLIGKRYYWDFLRLFSELKEGLRRVASQNYKIESIGIDTWGVDYGLLDKNNELISNPVHYRDKRTEKSSAEVLKNLSFEDIYSVTGIQNLQFNTLYQLYSDMKDRPEVLDAAKALLFIPDLLCFYLTGSIYNEYTVASTSQMLNASTKKWAYDLINKLSLPSNILQNIIMPGTIYGFLSEDICSETGIDKIPVIAVGSHDTASAVAGTPLESESSAYLSCGTWSLLGMELNKPIVDGSSADFTFTNEGGVNDTIRYLKNINGLWIIQQLKQSLYLNGIDVTFEQLSRAASMAQNNEFYINPDDETFIVPQNMYDSIKRYCSSRFGKQPSGIHEITRAAYNGIAMQYKNTVDRLEKSLNMDIGIINMVGGGIQDKLLCQLTADYTKKTVKAGPIEASVLGNIIMQLISIGEIDNLLQGRKLIADSFVQKVYMPR